MKKRINNMKYIIISLMVLSWTNIAIAANFTLDSPAFKEGASIPKKYTCQGEDKSPPFKWSYAPKGTKSFVLICEDPDIPDKVKKIWDHWIVFNIPATTNHLDENAKGLQMVQNSAGKDEYHGPCPPDRQHRYFWRLLALDTTLDLPAGATKTEVLDKARKHMLGSAELMGTYVKSK